MATGYGHAFDSNRMLAAAATVTADTSGGATQIDETPMDGLTARMVIASLTDSGTGGGAVRLRILATNNSASSYQTIAASPAVNVTGADAAGTDGIELLVRFGCDWDWIKYAIDTFAGGTGTIELRHSGIGLVEDGVKFPQWAHYGMCYWTDGTDVQL